MASRPKEGTHTLGDGPNCGEVHLSPEPDNHGRERNKESISDLLRWRTGRPSPANVGGVLRTLSSLRSILSPGFGWAWTEHRRRRCSDP